MPGRKELAHNASRWANACKLDLKKAGIDDVGFVFTFFPKGAPGAAICVGNVGDRRLKSVIKDIAKSFSDSRIVTLD